MSEPMRVHVRGAGLVVTEATPGAIQLAGREILGIPLLELMTEPPFCGPLPMIREAITAGRCAHQAARTLDGTLGQVVVEPTGPLEGDVFFRPTGTAILQSHGPDLFLGYANAAYDQLAAPRQRGIPAREAWPEPDVEEAQDVMRWVMRSGVSMTVELPGPTVTGTLRIVKTGARQVTTALRPLGLFVPALVALSA